MKKYVVIFIQVSFRYSFVHSGVYSGMATEGPVFLSLARYYVMRLPYIYKGPSGQFTCSPKWPEFQGKLLRNFIDVHQISFSHS